MKNALMPASGSWIFTTGDKDFLKPAHHNRRFFALLTTTAPRAFNNPGWKMDGDKLALDADGNPIFINSAGQEQAVRGEKIAELNAEAKQHRTRAEKAEGDLAKYRDASGKLIDPTEAIKAIDTVSKIDAKTLIDAGKVDEVREQMRSEFTTQLNEANGALKERDSIINTMKIDKLFDSSEFVRDRLAVPADMFRDSMARNFKIGDNGDIEAYDRSGNRLMSKKSPGDYAKGDEAFELLVEQHPQKDVILKAQQQGGSGNGGGGGQRGTGRNIKRADFEAMDAGSQRQIAEQMGKGEVTITD